MAESKTYTFKFSDGGKVSIKANREPTHEEALRLYREKKAGAPGPSEDKGREQEEPGGQSFWQEQMASAQSVVDEASKPPAIHPELPAAARKLATDLVRRVEEGATAADLQLEIEELGRMGLNREELGLLMEGGQDPAKWNLEADMSTEWRPPKKEEPKGVLDILGETVGAPMAQAAERFVPTAERLAAAGPRSQEEQRMFRQTDLKGEIRRLQKDPTATEGPGSLPSAENYDEWLKAVRLLASLERPAPEMLSDEDLGAGRSVVSKAAEALTPQFAQDIVYDVGRELEGEGAETTAQLRSPLMRVGAEILDYTFRSPREEEEEEEGEEGEGAKAAAAGGIEEEYEWPDVDASTWLKPSEDVFGAEKKARAWARGDVPQPGEGIAENLQLGDPTLGGKKTPLELRQEASRLGTGLPPEEEPGYLEGGGIWAGAVSGRAKGLIGGAIVGAGTELDKFQERMKMQYARMVRQEALKAKKDGKRAVRLPFTPHAVDVDTVLSKHNEEQAAQDWARLTDLRSEIGEAHDRLKDRLKEKLKDSPGTFSWYTVKNWREAVGELASGLGGLFLYAGGMTGLPEKLELDARGRYVVPVEDFWDAFSAAQSMDTLMGGTLANEAIAGFAINVHPETMASALEVDGPVALLDVVPYFAYAKAAAVAGKIKLPASALKKIDYLLDLAQPMADYLGDPYHQLRRYVAESGSNVDRLMTEGYDLITRNTREEQAAVDNALKQVARMVEEGFELGLGERAEPFKTLDGPGGEKLEIFPEERRAFEDATERLVREDVETAGGRVVPAMVPDEVARRAAERTFDEDVVTDSARGREILREEMLRHEEAGGKTTRTVEIPGTKGREKGSKADTAELDESQSALWDKVNDRHDALIERAKKEAGRERKKRKTEEAKKEVFKELGTRIAKIENSRKMELNAVVERLHDDLTTRFETTGDKLARVTADAQVRAALEIVEGRSPWGTRGRGDDAKQVPIGTNVWTAKAEAIPSEGRAFLRTPSTREIEAFARHIDASDLTTQQKRDAMQRFRGQGIYRGEEWRSAGQPKVTPRIHAAPEIRAAINRIVDIVGRDKADKFRLLNEIEANIARSIDQQLPEFLRSETARKRLSQELAAAVQRRASKQGPLDKATRDGLVASIYGVLEEIGSGKTPESGRPGSALPLNIEFRVRHPNGKYSHINMLDEVASLVFKNKETASRIVMESLVQTARRQSIRRSQKSMQNAYTDMVDPVFDWAERVMALTGRTTGEVTPKSETFRGVATQLTEKSMPTMFAESGTDMKGEIAGILEDAERFEEMRKFLSRDKDKGGLGREVTEAEARRALNRLKRRVSTYVDVGSSGYDHLRSLLHIGDDLYNADRIMAKGIGAMRQLARERRKVDVKAIPMLGLNASGEMRTGSVYMQKNLANALNTYGKAAAAANDADAFLQGTVFLKANLTSRQLTTLKNNVMSNVILQAVRRGDPFVLARMVHDIIKYKMFERGGKGLSDADVEMFQALSDSGKINTSFVDAEISALNKGGVIENLSRQAEGKTLGGVEASWRISPKMKKFLEAVDLPQRVIEDVYRFSDEMFKIEEGVRSYKQIDRWLNKLNDGEHIELKISPVRRARLVKLGDDLFELDGKALSADKLRAIVGKASMQVGEDLFFNFFDVADWARTIRTSSGFALVSPFYTWFSKALDIPFVKKGLLSEIYRGSPSVKTNNASILFEVAANQSRIGATMDMVKAYGSQEPYDAETMRTMRKTFGWGRGTQMGVVDTFVHTSLVRGYVSLNQANPWGPTDLIFRSIEGGVPAILDSVGLGDDASDIVRAYSTDGELDWDLKNLSPEARNKALKLREFMMRRASGEAGISLSDGLDLIGMAGSPILEIWHLAAEAEKRDKPVSWQGMAMRMANMLVGGTYAKAFDSILGGTSPTHPLTSRYRFSDPIAGEEETWLVGAMRKVTGIGWQKKNVLKRGEAYFNRLEQKWDDALVAPISQDIRLLERRAADTNLGPDARLETLTQLKNAGKLKARMRKIILREVGSMRKEHFKLVIEMKQTKTTKEDELPPGAPPRKGSLNVIKGAQ